MSRRTVALAAALVLAFGAGLVELVRGEGEIVSADGPVSVTSRQISFDPANPAKLEFGALVWNGGLELSGPESFGGISGLILSRDGAAFVAVTDLGSWIRGQLSYADGRLVGLRDVQMAPMRGPSGTPMKRKADVDAEALARAGPGELLVAFERRHRILSYRTDRNGRPGTPQPVAVPDDFARLGNNQGIEGLDLLPGREPGGRVIVAIAEYGQSAEGHHDGLLIAGDGSAKRFTLTNPDGFGATDLAFLPGGDMLLLERKFVPVLGASFRLRRFALSQIAPGAMLAGTLLLEAGSEHSVDNMEGLAVHRDGAGRTILTLVSDDNFSVGQRTLLMQFVLPGES